ncbi:hypothetical protein [Streptomyces sp. SM12]|uniref:hypothetical protein n=1 Tax=Streptomyces sp. SM12 TaxID=1071602 RepID=UPI000CD5B24F|nr:hypothetical protein [Streptomyces sp. SM12]
MSDAPKTVEELTAELASVTSDRDHWKAMSRKNETDKKTAIADLDKSKVDHATALSTAVDTAKADTRKEFSAKVAETAFRAAANGRVADVDAVIKNIDVTRFATDAGDPDNAGISAFLDGIAPASAPTDGAPNNAPDHSALFAAQGAQGQSGSALALNDDRLYQQICNAIGAPVTGR